MFLRERESDLASVTAGNGAIYADPAARPTSSSTPSWATTSASRSPWSAPAGAAVYQPAARATERMVPSIEGESARKRRMMSHAWAIVLHGGLLDPRGWPAALHGDDRQPPLAALLRAVPAPRRAAPPVRCWRRLLALARGGRSRRAGRALVGRYYVLTQASIALGLFDHLREGTPAGWDPPEGTRA